MPILLRIALRNLVEHKGKTLIIGILVALGVIVLIVGNSLMETAREGIARAFVDNYTGDVMISGTAEGPISLFGVQSVGGIDPTPILPAYTEIVEIVEQTESIDGWTTQITGFAFLRPEDERIDGVRNSVLTVLFGSESESYHELFDNVRIVEGLYLEPGEQGLMISTDRAAELEEEAIDALADDDIEVDSYPVSAGDEVRIVGLTSDGLPSIRVVPIVAIYETTGISEGVGFELVSYIDPQTLRAILRLNLGSGSEVEIDRSQTELLDKSGTDDPFSDDDLFGEDVFEERDDASNEAQPFDFEGFGEIDDEPEDSATAEDEDVAALADGIDPRLASQTWHYILASVENPRRVESTIGELNRAFEEAGIDAQAGNWEVAAGPFATTAEVIRTVFNVAVIVIGIVAVIIMMNTLVISVMERTSEIGTMRALGAQRRFVWKMFMYETLVITTVFGMIGVATALGIIGILYWVGIPATNTFLTVLFAGPELKPVASAVSILGGLIIVSVIGLIAHIYPVAVALRIQPIRAIQTD
ncbi:MAG: ABC transporter permease [Spirochaetota bacterium]